MEASSEFDTLERLSAFLDRTVAFLDAVARTPSLGTETERLSLIEALAELAEIQLERSKADLNAAREELIVAGFSDRQMNFKLGVADRAMEDTQEPTPTGWMAPTAIWRTLGKLKVVLGSLKGLSKWLEALDELVGMTGELAKNRIGSKPE
jgi:plasmid replication initiation protein